jgi:hypothetical protein
LKGILEVAMKFVTGRRYKVKPQYVLRPWLLYSGHAAVNYSIAKNGFIYVRESAYDNYIIVRTLHGKNQWSIRKRSVLPSPALFQYLESL